MARRWRRLAAVAGVVMAAAVLPACQPATPFAVNTTTDAADASPGDGACETATPGECTLRAALMEASTLPPESSSTIHLEADADYALSLAGIEDAGVAGDLDTRGDIEIVGNNATISGYPNRVFEHHEGRLVLRDLTITNGFADPTSPGSFDPYGAGIANHAELQLVDVELVDHVAMQGGAAVHQTTGSTTLIRTRVYENHAGWWGPAAAIYVEDGGLTVIDSEISSTWPVQVGMSWSGTATGIRQVHGTTAILGSTISSHLLRFFACTVRCGWIELQGIGVDIDGTAEIRWSTFEGNHRDIDGSGAVSVGASSMQSCYVAITSLGYNRDADGSCLGAGTTGDVTSATPAVGSLDFHGGPTRNHVPLAGSVLVDAIPAGTPVLCDGTAPTDQRGSPRPAGAACDIGSVERQPTDP
jgi:CSLREA domain-containing protein